MSLPSVVLRNQYGEVSNNFIKTGSSEFLWCNFIVDKTNGNGLGIRSLKSSGRSATPDIANVYMATSATAATGNPMGSGGAGIILVEFQNPYAGYISGTAGFVSQLSGSNINVTSALTPGTPYTVTSVGTTTLAGWQSIGWIGTVLPTVGATFVNTSATPTTGTGVVQTLSATGPSSQGLYGIYPIGDPNQTVISSKSMVLGIFGATASGTTTPELVTPSNNMVIGLTFSMINVPKSLI